VRPTVRFPVHPPYEATVEETEEGDEDRFIGRDCYEFNRSLKAPLDDTRCSHCRFYLTAQCAHIDDFMDDVEDLAPE
jgi:hypothetical protein